MSKRKKKEYFYIVSGITMSEFIHFREKLFFFLRINYLKYKVSQKIRNTNQHIFFYIMHF